MDWCCLAGLLAGGVPPGRIRIWGILISLHLFSLSGTHFVGGGNGVPFLGDTLAWAGLREGEALGVSEGRLPFSRSSPPGHAVVLRFGWCGVAGGVMDSAVLVVERCADSEVGGREGGSLAGLFPGWSIFVELYICFVNILWSR